MGKIKEIWTVFGRKKRLEVDENNQVIREIEDLGPLSELEMEWVKANSGMAYPEWLAKKEEDQ